MLPPPLHQKPVSPRQHIHTTETVRGKRNTPHTPPTKPNITPQITTPPGIRRRTLEVQPPAVDEPRDLEAHARVDEAREVAVGVLEGERVGVGEVLGDEEVELGGEGGEGCFGGGGFGGCSGGLWWGWGFGAREAEAECREEGRHGGDGDGCGGPGRVERWDGGTGGMEMGRRREGILCCMYICGQRSTCQAHLDPIMAVAVFASGGGEVSWWRPGVVGLSGVLDEPAVVSLITGRCRVQFERRGRAITQATEMETFNTRFQAPNDYDWWHSSHASDQIFGWGAKRTSCKAVSW